jgi:hypothetical protein
MKFATQEKKVVVRSKLPVAAKGQCYAIIIIFGYFHQSLAGKGIFS